MSFLDKIKAKRVAEAQAAANKVETPVDATPVEVEQLNKDEQPVKKSAISSILARRKNAEANKAAKAVETIIQKPKAEAEVSPNNEPAAKLDTEDTADETMVDKLEDSVVNTPDSNPDADDVTVEDSTDTAEADDEVTDAEEEKPRKRRRRRTTAKKNEDTESSKTLTILNAREFQIQNIVDTKMSYEEMVAKYESAFTDKAWEEYQQEIVSELEEIRVAADMNPGTLRITLTQLNDLDGKITIEHAKFKALLESLTNKEDGVCTCIRYQAMAEGANENERRANGYAALCNATYNGEPINYINLIAGTRMKFIFLDSIKQRIRSMSSMCITFLGTMKIENTMDALAQ